MKVYVKPELKRICVCGIQGCEETANYWWHSAVGNKRLSMCFGHSTHWQKTGGWRERKEAP